MTSISLSGNVLARHKSDPIPDILIQTILSDVSGVVRK